MIKSLIARIKQSDNTRSLKPFDISLVATALLIEVIKADHQQTEIEFEALRKHCSRAFALSSKEMESLIQEAISLSNKATSLWEYTDLINQHMNSDSKYQLIIDMWRIAYSDNELDSYEEHLIRKVSDLIYLPHTLFIKAKHEALKLVEQIT